MKLREHDIKRGLAGTREVTIKRVLITEKIPVAIRGQFAKLQVAIDGRKVKGVMVIPRIKVDTAMKVFYRYYGAGAADQRDPAFIASLNKEMIRSRSGYVEVNAGENQKIYLASPVELGMLNIVHFDLLGGFESPDVVTIQNENTGAQVDYYVYESINSNLGQTQLEIE